MGKESEPQWEWEREEEKGWRAGQCQSTVLTVHLH